MEARDFVKQLAEATPSLAELESCGLASENVKAFIESYTCTVRDHPLTEPSGSDSLLELLRNWDLSKVEIGLIRFPGFHAEPSGAIHIGCVEADPLILLPNGEIVVYESGTKDHLLWRVAKSGTAFLDALVIAARFLGRRAVGTIDIDDHEAARSVALECAAAAGGDRFKDFYTMLLGAM